jgi:hypothetical protein
MKRRVADRLMKMKVAGHRRRKRKRVAGRRKRMGCGRSGDGKMSEDVKKIGERKMEKMRILVRKRNFES